MYLGHLVELAGSAELVARPLHPYTQALLQSVPIPDPKITRSRKRAVLEGETPSPLDIPAGCPFRTLCPLTEKRCAGSVPELREVSNGHWVACHCI
jgi:oligopeptide transport system ATP-binding protein